MFNGRGRDGRRFLHAQRARADATPPALQAAHVREEPEMVSGRGMLL